MFSQTDHLGRFISNSQCKVPLPIDNSTNIMPASALADLATTMNETELEVADIIADIWDGFVIAPNGDYDFTNAVLA